VYPVGEYPGVHGINNETCKIPLYHRFGYISNILVANLFLSDSRIKVFYLFA